MERTPPKNYLIESILVTFFCCQPLGIVGIVFASQVNSKIDFGDYNGAEKASLNAKNWMTWGFIIGLITILGMVSLAFFIGGFSTFFNQFN